MVVNLTPARGDKHQKSEAGKNCSINGARGTSVSDFKKDVTFVS